MGTNLSAALAFITLILGMAWLNTPHAGDIQGQAKIEIPKSYEGIAKAGYPLDIILAIARLEHSLGLINQKIASLSEAKRRLAAMDYREPLFAWWPGMAPKGHPEGSLWLLSQYLDESCGLLQKRLDALVEATAYSKNSLSDLEKSIELSSQVALLEMDVQWKIHSEDRDLDEKYKKLASEIGAMPPQKMLGYRSLAEAVKARL